MIVVGDYIREDGALLKKVYSDKSVYIRKVSTGQEYVSAVNENLTEDMYEETDQLIEEPSIEEYEVPEQDF